MLRRDAHTRIHTYIFIQKILPIWAPTCLHRLGGRRGVIGRSHLTHLSSWHPRPPPFHPKQARWWCSPSFGHPTKRTDSVAPTAIHRTRLLSSLKPPSCRAPRCKGMMIMIYTRPSPPFQSSEPAGLRLINYAFYPYFFVDAYVCMRGLCVRFCWWAYVSLRGALRLRGVKQPVRRLLAL